MTTFETRKEMRGDVDMRIYKTNQRRRAGDFGGEGADRSDRQQGQIEDQGEPVQSESAAGRRSRGKTREGRPDPPTSLE
ncbi:hypothetical protein NDU88_004076 [Pleurodeles waltl]|uniref:Uncharacterized protein n=1 Tax=Pleurodeles waltl TaxID=8319 RepID=A0AAV7WUL1_PLEWA|nr:hypothetical protein NDU88_004076 [Pleurodeles waltl]